MSITKACAQKMMSEGIFQWNEHYPHSKVFETDLKRGELYVLLIGNTVQGCITLSTLKDEEYEDILWLTKDQNNIRRSRSPLAADSFCFGVLNIGISGKSKIKCKHIEYI